MPVGLGCPEAGRASDPGCVNELLSPETLDGSGASTCVRRQDIVSSSATTWYPPSGVETNAFHGTERNGSTT
jgi:hypothetical protein